ncbi:hypothetical protein QTI66_23200 [Variovorax sp. J22R133]|uniref:hypothetical protein n=1 Tax=Variovorax brevis TaxID=3053503 RepID=UPI0025771AF9|nr:hypothetical protein [Variovorax sp. J22R133]MDM0115075.1 hypothetical protein [Variovorax sp. J22R133]
MLLVACSSAPITRPVVQPPPPPPVVPATPRVVPVEAEPTAPATQPALQFMAATAGPVAAVLAYADKVRPLGPPEINAEISRIGEPGEIPLIQMQLALALAQTKQTADLARAAGLMQRVATSQSPDAQPLQPLARTLATRYAEQRRVEDERDKQAQQLRDSARRIDQLNDRIEALRAIERSFTRPSNPSPVPAAPAANGK